LPALGTFFLALILWNLTPDLQEILGLNRWNSEDWGAARWVWPLVSLVLMPALVSGLLLWPDSLGRPGKRPLTRRRWVRAQISGSLTSLFAWAASLLAFDWQGTIASVIPSSAYGVTMLLACLPLLAGLALLTIPQGRASGISSASSQRAEMWRVLRPNLIVLLPFAVIQGLEEWTRLNPDLFLALPSLAQFFLIGLPVLLILGLAPWLFEKILKSTPLPAGSMKDRFLALCQKSGLRDVQPKIWQTGQRPMANAMMTGLLPYQRRVFMTDVLLDSLSEDEQDAVLAHELAHARRFHLWIYLLFCGAIILWAWLADAWLADLLPEDIVLWITPCLFLILFFFGFRNLSHHMEHEADLYSESLCEKPGSIIQALLRLRRHNPQSLEKSSWRHPSTLQRIRILHAHRGNPVFRKRFDGKGRWIRRLILVALVGGGGLVSWQSWQAPQVPEWQVTAEEAIDHLLAFQERVQRPNNEPARMRELILATEERLVKSVAELRTLDPKHPSLSPLLLQLAEIYDQLDQPWNALACRLQERQIPVSE